MWVWLVREPSPHGYVLDGFRPLIRVDQIDARHAQASGTSPRNC